MTLAFAQFGRIFAALGAGRHADAYEAAERLFDPASPAHHPVVACWLIGDLAEAALRANRAGEARARVKQVAAASGDTPGTCASAVHGRAGRVRGRGGPGRHVWIMDVLPKGPTGKIQKRDIVIPADLPGL